MKKIVVMIALAAAVILGGSCMALAGDSNRPQVAADDDGTTELSISLSQYVNAYIENSDTIQSAQDKLDDAAAAYDRAVEEKKTAALDLQGLKNTAYQSKLSLEETKSNVAVEAVQTYFNLAQVLQSLESQNAALAVAKENLRVTTLRYDAGLTTDDSVLQQQNSYLSAEDSVIKAEQNKKVNIKSFCEAVGIDPCDEVVLTTGSEIMDIQLPKYDLPECIEANKTVNSSYFSAAAAAELAEKRYNAQQDPMIATKTEMQTAADNLETAKKALDSATDSLETSVKDALDQLEAYNRALEMQKISVQISDSNLNVTKIQFNHGEILQYELDSAVNSNNSSHIQLQSAKQNLFLQMLRIEALIGKSVVDIISEAADK